MKRFKYPSQTSEDANENAFWIQSQRNVKKGLARGILNNYRIKKMESLPKWGWNEFDERWNNSFTALERFIHINKRYPLSRSNDKEEKKLGAWLYTKKSAKKGKGDWKLTEKRITQLESLPDWEWEIDFEEKWNGIFKELKMFIENFKKYPLRDSKDAREKKLGGWASNQRRAKRGNCGRLKISPERIAKLETLTNWSWEGRFGKIT